MGERERGRQREGETLLACCEQPLTWLPHRTQLTQPPCAAIAVTARLSPGLDRASQTLSARSEPPKATTSGLEAQEATEATTLEPLYESVLTPESTSQRRTEWSHPPL